MRERIKTIKQCYKALEYGINKQKARKTVNTLHCKLKRDIYNFSDRVSQTVSIIEKNLSVFKSACNHVDVITTILDFLHTIGVKLMFKRNNDSTADEFIIIYIMLIVFDEEYEIPTFLRACLMNDSMFEQINLLYEPLFDSNYVYEMIVLEDSDLCAVFSYLRITPSFLLKITKIYIQESIKQKFLWLLEKYFQDFLMYFIESDFLISIFRTKKELHTFPPFASLTTIHMVSIWSEDIAAAKVLATTLRKDITFINAHFEFCPNITFSWKWSASIFNLFQHVVWDDFKDGDKVNPNEYVGSVYDLFYNGVWQKPVKNRYWIHNENTYAHATKEDVTICTKSAEEAYKNWSLLPIVSRRKILENLASTLECNGKFLFQCTVLDSIELLNIHYNELESQDERLEMICFHGPKGVVSIYARDEVALFRYLTLSLILGNCVIVLHNKNSCTLAPYLNMFSTAEIPPGVVNLLSCKNMSNSFSTENYDLSGVIKYCTSINHIILPLK